MKEYFITPGKTTTGIEPDPALPIMLERSYLWPVHSGLVLRETLISPILTEVYVHFRPQLTFFSAVEWAAPIVAENKLELSGVCDYLIGGEPYMSRPKSPILCVVEAKKEDFETGTWQCAAELFACRLSNQRAGINYAFYYGCVASGRLWNFIKLENDILIRDPYYYALQNLPQLLGVWRWVLNRQIEAKIKTPE